MRFKAAAPAAVAVLQPALPARAAEPLPPDVPPDVPDDMVAVWQVQGDSNNIWIDYDVDFSARLESLHLAGGGTFEHMPGQKHKYSYDLAAMIQTHVTNTTRRVMRRVLMPRAAFSRTRELQAEVTETNAAIWRDWEQQSQRRQASRTPAPGRGQRQVQPARAGDPWSSWRPCGNR